MLWCVDFPRWCQVGVKISSIRFVQDERLEDFSCKSSYFRSGAEGIRTPDLRRAKAALSQLSYGPSCSGLFYPVPSGITRSSPLAREHTKLAWGVSCGFLLAPAVQRIRSSTLPAASPLSPLVRILPRLRPRHLRWPKLGRSPETLDHDGLHLAKHLHEIVGESSYTNGSCARGSTSRRCPKPSLLWFAAWPSAPACRRASRDNPASPRRAGVLVRDRSLRVVRRA